MSAPWRASCVAFGDRAVLIEGAPGSGKSSLALALIDRGAMLVGDDAVLLSTSDGRLCASPPPNATGLLEVRNLGLLQFPTVSAVPVALVMRLDADAPRFIEEAEQIELCDFRLPMVRLWPDTPVLALRAELALTRYGLA